LLQISSKIAAFLEKFSSGFVRVLFGIPSGFVFKEGAFQKQHRKEGGGEVEKRVICWLFFIKMWKTVKKTPTILLTLGWLGFNSLCIFE